MQGSKDGAGRGSNRLFDDFARLMTDAAGAAQGVKREAETVFKAQVERLIRDMSIEVAGVGDVASGYSGMSRLGFRPEAPARFGDDLQAADDGIVGALIGLESREGHPGREVESSPGILDDGLASLALALRRREWHPVPPAPGHAPSRFCGSPHPPPPGTGRR